jgi:hypothetical protein
MDNFNEGGTRPDKKRENIFLHVVKNYLIYVIMAASIGAAIFFSEFLKEEFSENIIKYAKNKNRKKFYLPTILMVIAILIIFIGYAVKGSKEFKKTEEKKMAEARPKTYVKKLSKEEYEKVKAETTQRELQKLYENPKFKRLLNERGTDSKNWTWQTKEKEKKVVYRDNDNSEDISDLSKITISDD